jgi:enterochelin esterase-like enzyme
MGGFHTIHISRIYPGTFDYMGAFSAALLPDQDLSSPVFDDLDGTLKKQMEEGYKLYFIACGNADFLYRNNQDLMAKLDEQGMPYTFRESEGGHIWKNWRLYLTEFAPKLFK